jgi:aconitate hydratase
MTEQKFFSAKRSMSIHTISYAYYSLKALEEFYPDVHKLPVTLKILLENLLRHQASQPQIEALANWARSRYSSTEVTYYPLRVLMQDFTGVPAIVDLAALRDAVKDQGDDPTIVNPLTRVDLIIDHSVIVDDYGHSTSFEINKSHEYERNKERYQFLKWGQQAFDNFGVVPPGTGICHQVNLEYLAKVVWPIDQGNEKVLCPDTLVGTDSHTTMVNGLSVLGWGVGGIEAEAVMLGLPISMRIPDVVGFKLEGRLSEGVTATDLVLTITQMLRKKGVVGKFVEFYGSGLSELSLADRATIANMAPEYGATCGFFPIDQETLAYLKLTGRDPHHISVVEAYAKEQGLWYDPLQESPFYTEIISLVLSTVEPSLAGPKRPQDHLVLSQVSSNFDNALEEEHSRQKETFSSASSHLKHGDVVIAAITSCTNTSNPFVMIAAGLVARKALEKGLKVKPWIKTSLAPGSQVVSDYLQLAGLDKNLNDLGFNLVGYGCTTCIGNSGPLKPAIEKEIIDSNLMVSAVLSGNRNFEGRIHPLVKANYLGSPPLVVVYALAGTVRINLQKDPLGSTLQGESIYLKDIWPSNEEIDSCVRKVLSPDLFKKRYAKVFEGDHEWQSLKTEPSLNYKWDTASTYIKKPPYFKALDAQIEVSSSILGMRALAILGDSITTDHISPAGSIKKDSPAGLYLLAQGVVPKDFNSYGARRGNHEVMVRGTFANIRIRNEMVPQLTGGMTLYVPENKTMSIFDAAMLYQKTGTPLIIIAGKEYGTGSSRDWAAKGTQLLGAKAVIAESFERIHRSNLIGMGVLPLTFSEGHNRKTLNLTGQETFEIHGMDSIAPRSKLKLTIIRSDGTQETVTVHCQIQTEEELAYYQHKGILPYVLKKMRKR